MVLHSAGCFRSGAGENIKIALLFCRSDTVDVLAEFDELAFRRVPRCPPFACFLALASESFTFMLAIPSRSAPA
ncbi:hypothetical protein [Citrobacter freundii]|uniref:hypothetical protein n=1 Tax=Citrobacter freundii TaxID=546 RepID=UPI00110F3159|nr:hypothetical protein [Citrobacter freundii]QCW56097.1 hypothetical protein FGF61_18605 [Citrobacter freundii]